MPIHRARMLESPVNRNPPRPPRLHPNLFRPRRVSPNFKQVEVLPRENVPVSIQKSFPQLFRQRLQRLPVIQVVRINRIVFHPRAYEVVILRIVLLRPLESRRRLLVDPQRLHPRVPNVPRVRRPRHARKSSWNRAPVPRGQKLPLLQSEVRQLIYPDEQKLRALVLVNIILIPAVPKSRRRSIRPRNDVLGFVVAFVQIAWHSPPQL